MEEPVAIDLPRLVAALAADIAALRSEISGKNGNQRRGESVPAFPAPLFDMPLSATPPGFDARCERAEEIAAETGEPVGIVQISTAIFPEVPGSATTNAPVTLLRFTRDALAKPEARVHDEGTRNERAARIAASLGAEPRVTVARLLLTEPTLTAAQLGTGAELTTGSLYHHLREMTHAGVLAVVSRNRYTLTPLGRRSLLALLALAESDTAV